MPNTVIQPSMFTSGTFGPSSDAASSPKTLADTNAASIATANVAASMTRSLSNITSRASTDMATHDATLISNNWSKSVTSPLLSRDVISDSSNTTFVSSQGLCISYSIASCPANSKHVNLSVSANDLATSPICHVVHMTSLSSPVCPRQDSFDNDAAAIVHVEIISMTTSVTTNEFNTTIINDKANANRNKEPTRHFLRRQRGQRDSRVSLLFESQSLALSGWINSCQSISSSQNSDTYSPRASFNSYW